MSQMFAKHNHNHFYRLLSLKYLAKIYDKNQNILQMFSHFAYEK